MSAPTPAKARGSKSELPIHRACALFPDMPTDEYKELVADIKANGCHVPVVLYDGVILDGRHRWKACAELKIDCPTVNWKPKKGQSPTEYAVALNMHRRHLSAGQRAAIRADAIPLIRAEKAKVSNETSGDTLTAAAKSAGVSRATMARADKRRREDPEAHEAAKRGEKPKKSSGPPPARKPKPKPVLDGLGFEAKHPKLREAIESAGELRQLVIDIIKCRTRVRNFCKAGSEATRCVHHQTVDTDLKNAFIHLKFAMPFTICGYCGGQKRGCKACDGSGWVTEKIFKMTPRDMQAAVKRKLAEQSGSKAE
ncbi:MAG: ParB N-terminal domain-containing protein [Planctomycetes bacterium]|nr:ParB N-terminal domain-containing protein [Planctomycetota bacterium]